jgi:hypothetical protein
MSRAFLIIGGSLVFVWLLSLSWVFGMWLAYVHAERRDRRYRRRLVAERAGNERRIAAMFGEWEREHIEWRRQRSEQIHPSQRGDTDRQGDA